MIGKFTGSDHLVRVWGNEMVASLFMSPGRGEAPGGGTAVSRRARILLVAESPALARAHAEHLRHASFDAEWAVSEHEALSSIRRRLPDVVLLDLQASDADGRALLRRLKNASEPVGIVIVTAPATVDRAVDAVRSGAHDFIVKPVGATKLIEAVRKAVHRVNAERRSGRPRAVLPARSDDLDRPWSGPSAGAAQGGSAGAAPNPEEPAIRPLWMVERDAIEAAIAHCRGNISRAAGMLEISASTIYRKRLAWQARSPRSSERKDQGKM